VRASLSPVFGGEGTVRGLFAQPPHLQAGVQVAPGRHLHVEPHLQAGPHAQLLLFWLGVSLVVSDFESRPLTEDFMGCSCGWVIGREPLYPPSGANT
jgi:hypothetical protein